MSEKQVFVKPRSDLGIRTLSGVVMMLIAALAIWLGGWVFVALVVAVGLGVIWEWWGLASRIAKRPVALALWMVVGVSYVGLAMAVLVGLREMDVKFALLPIMLVIAVDVGAYFAGRSIGGPKIAPAISPSKTWAGLGGGIAFAALMLTAYHLEVMSLFDFGSGPTAHLIPGALGVGAMVAVVAQAGDFFESWMKRRAGVKDSGNLIPGHGGLFDRTDGLIAVIFAFGIYLLLNFVFGEFALTPPPR